MTPAAARAAYERQMKAHGGRMRLVRAGGSTQGVEVMGRVYALDDDPLEGTAQQNQRRAIIMAHDVTGKPIALPIASNRDRLVWAGRTLVIVSADDGTRRVGDELIAIDLMLAGA